MSIKPSASIEIRTLIAALASDDEVRRESAVARLAIIGARAVDRLTVAYGEADRDTRFLILRTAEAIADPRATAISLDALASGGDLAVAAISVLRTQLDSPITSAATQSLDALVGTALDPTIDRRIRLAAFDALQDMPPAVRDRVAEALRRDEDPALQTRASAAPRDAAATDGVWQDALEGQLPEDPAILREALKSRAAVIPLSGLQKLVEAVRTREHASVRLPVKEGWRQVRGALHQALALRGSRVAVYDLRETLSEAREPLPAAFLAALHVVGDESCLEPIAGAWTAAAEVASPDVQARWRQQLEAAFQAIVKREKIPARSAALKRIAGRFPEAAADLSTTSRTTPRPTRRART